MKVQWYRVKKTYEKPHDGFLVAVAETVLTSPVPGRKVTSPS
jgi:hypothetical protein